MSHTVEGTHAELLAFRICTLREEGNFKDAVDLCLQLIAHDPSRLDFRFLEFDILYKINDRAMLETRILDAMTHLPQSIEIGVYYAAVPMWYFDWSVAVERLNNIRTRFPPDVSVDVAATILDEFRCYFEMTDIDRAQKLINKNWGLLKKWPASQYKGRNEIFEIGSMIEKRKFDEYILWSAEGLNGDAKRNYLVRMEAATQIQTWVTKNARDIDIVSLGQNCLPWLVPNRWGLRPFHHTARPMSVFDYIGTPKESAAELIVSNFSDLLASGNLTDIRSPNGSPMLMNKEHRILFFHEKGMWWAADKWRRLHDVYRERIHFFMGDHEKARRLYVFLVSGACDLSVVVRCFNDKLSINDSRLLVLNAREMPLDIQTKSRSIAVRNIPYPKNYSFVDRDSFESDDGHNFESSIARSIIEELKSMLPPRNIVSRFWRRLKKSNILLSATPHA